MMYLKIVLCMIVSMSVSVQAQTDDDVLRQLVELRAELTQQYSDIENRLERLEQLISPQYSVQVVPDAPAKSMPETIKLEPAVPRWQKPEAWAKIRPGMNRADILAILGAPSSEKKNIIDYVTLFYVGNNTDGKLVNGSVTLTDSDRVEYRGINIPRW